MLTKRLLAALFLCSSFLFTSCKTVYPPAPKPVDYIVPKPTPSPVTPSPSPVNPSPPEPLIPEERFDKLQVGWTTNQVLELLGTPKRVSGPDQFNKVSWHYRSYGSGGPRDAELNFENGLLYDWLVGY